jgi:hypothetical protein
VTAEGVISPDGQWRWNGHEWQPHAASAPTCPQCGLSDAVRSVRGIAAEGTTRMALGGVSMSAGMTGGYDTWNVGILALGGRSVSTLAECLGQPPAPGTPPRTGRGTLGVVVLMLGVLVALAGIAGMDSHTAGGNTSGAVTLVVGCILLAGGAVPLAQDRRIRGAQLRAAQRHHAAAFDVWVAVLYCARCDTAWHPRRGIFGPSAVVPHAIHAEASATVPGTTEPTRLDWSS